MKRWRPWRQLIAFASTAIIVILAVRWVWFPGRAFDPAAWQDEVQIRSGARLEMADRLHAHGLLIGKSRAEVIDWLGEPKTNYFADWDLVYWLGPERGFMSIDSEWLVLRLGPDGRVADDRIVRD